MFKDRKQAGQLLSEKLRAYRSRPVIVLAIPRGGVPVARVIADELLRPLDIVVIRKLSAPWQPELAIGAVGPEGVCVLDSKLILELGINENYIKGEAEEKTDEVVSRIKRFKGDGMPLKLNGKTVILVDDGIATGATIEAGVRYLRKKKVKEIILAVPVAPLEVIEKFRKTVDKIVVLYTPTIFKSVGQFYEYFPQLTDDEVIKLLRR